MPCPLTTQAADLVRDLELRLNRFNIKSDRNLLARSGDVVRPDFPGWCVLFAFLSSHAHSSPCVCRYHESPHDILILKLVIAGAFYPNYFRWGVADEELNQREMSGHDPTSTVMVITPSSKHT